MANQNMDRKLPRDVLDSGRYISPIMCELVFQDVATTAKEQNGGLCEGLILLHNGGAALDTIRETTSFVGLCSGLSKHA